MTENINMWLTVHEYSAVKDLKNSYVEMHFMCWCTWAFFYFDYILFLKFIKKLIQKCLKIEK